MPGLAALAAALTAALAQPTGLVPRPGAALPLVTPPPLLALPVTRRSRLRACTARSSRPTVAGRRLLPVACEQPPRSNVTLPNGATGALSSLLGGGR
jgi:hypothetical protein